MQALCFSSVSVVEKVIWTNVNGMRLQVSPFVLNVERQILIMKAKARCVGMVTLVGYIGNSYPMPSGNCFGVYDYGDRHHKILNMNHENLGHLIKTGVVNFPLEIDILEEGYAIVTDERVPDNYFDKNYCSICSPKRLRPKEQVEHEEKLERIQIAWGILKVGEPNEHGFVMQQRSLEKIKRRANLIPKHSHLVRKSKRACKVNIPRRFPPTFSIQAMEDIRAMHSIDLKSSLIEVLEQEINDV